MRAFSSSRERGIALIIVMIAIAVLTILAAAFAYSMKVELKLAQNANSEEELLWLGRSGVELARYVVAQQLNIPNEPYDGLNQKWAGGTGGTNMLLADISLENNRLGDGTFSVKITDLERRFNVNIADQAVLQQALNLVGVEASDAQTVISSILDWIDRDNNTHVNGAESDYYESLDPPYSAKNGPVDDLSELLLVKGIWDNPEIFWGTGSTNHPPAAFQKIDRFGRELRMPSYPVGLVDLFTSIGTAKMNVNTASLTTLQMNPFVDEAIAGEIIRVRAGPDGVDGTEDDTPAGSFIMPRVEDLLVNAGMNRQTAQQAARYFDQRSRAFEVEVDAEVNGYHRHFVAILGRNNQRDVQVLSFYWKEATARVTKE